CPLNHARFAGVLARGDERRDGADEVFVSARELFAEIELRYGLAPTPGRPGGSSSADPIGAADRIILAAGPHPWVLFAVAEQLTERQLPMLAAYLADRLFA